MTEKKEQLDKVRVEQQRIAQMQQSEYQQQLQQRTQEEAQKLSQVLPEFSDPTKGEQIRNEIRNYGKSIGFTDQELSQVYDSRHVLTLHKAMMYDKLQKSKPAAKNITFDQRQNFRGAQAIGGAIFEANTDRSHPINFGYNKNKIALFRNTTLFVKPDSSSYKNPIQYTKNPLLSGYISKENLKVLAETIPFKSANMGKGKVIVFTDNTNFRAFWYGTNKLMMNAIFFAKMM